MSDRLASFYQRIDPHHLAPLWRVMAKLVPATPPAGCVPVHWRYAQVRELLMESGQLISAEEAERRVLVLENPAWRGQSQITNSLYGGIQLILPGETAPIHRHSATAIRLILEGDGGYTTVNGEPTSMQRGDFIITPSFTYHSHHNPGHKPMVWLDGLDVPMVQFLNTGFSDRWTGQEIAQTEDVSLARFASGLLPLGYEAKPAANPVFRYPYATTRAALARVASTGELHPVHGVKMQYANPTTGGPATPTMSAFLQWLPQKFAGQGYRSTDATVYCVVEGEGRSEVGDTHFDWGPNDVFVVPSWTRVRHTSVNNSVLFSMSDRAAQHALGLWREQEEA